MHTTVELKTENSYGAIYVVPCGTWVVITASSATIEHKVVIILVRCHVGQNTATQSKIGNL